MTARNTKIYSITCFRHLIKIYHSRAQIPVSVIAYRKVNKLSEMYTEEKKKD